MKEQEESLQTLLDTQQNELTAVASVTDSIQASNLAILGANVALLIFIAQANLALPLWQTLLLALPFLISTGCCLFPISSNYLGNVDLGKHPEYLTYARGDLLLQLISDTQYAIDHNNRVNYKRMVEGRVAQWSSLVGVCALVTLFAIM